MPLSRIEAKGLHRVERAALLAIALDVVFAMKLAFTDNFKVSKLLSSLKPPQSLRHPLSRWEGKTYRPPLADADC